MRIAAITLLSFLGPACYVGVSPPPPVASGGDVGPGAQEEAIQPRGTSLLIEVRDDAGQPVPKAIVTVMSEHWDGPVERAYHPLRDHLGSPAEAERPWLMTDGAGRLLLDQLPPGRLIVRADADGHAGGSAAVDLRQDAHLGAKITLPTLGRRHAFEIAAGADIRDGLVRLRLAPNSIVELDGTPVEGLAELTLTLVDPAGDRPLPWTLDGRREDGSEVLLHSVMMVDITPWQGKRPLRLADGATAELEVLLPETFPADLSDVPHWIYEFTAARWQEQGKGTIVASAEQPGRRVWKKTLTHFSPHNLDIPCIPGCIDVMVTDSDNFPVKDVLVLAEISADFGGGYFGNFTNDSGQTCIETCANFPVTVYAGGPKQPKTSVVKLDKSGENVSCGDGGCTPVKLQFPIGEAPNCTVGEFLPCAYPEPDLNGVGQCTAGKKVCDVSGHWTDCEGEVLPAPEACDTPIDEDCDGQIHDDEMNCVCTDGESNACYNGPAGTLGVGQCAAGIQLCAYDGKEWLFGACTGEIPPGNPEKDCESIDLDEDCDDNPACGYAQLGHVLGDGAIQEARTVATSPDGAFYVAGRFSGALTVAQMPVLPAPMVPGATHTFVARFGAGGELEGAYDLGDLVDIAMHPLDTGDLLVGGTLRGQVCGADNSGSSDDLVVVTLNEKLTDCDLVKAINLEGAQRITGVDRRGTDVVFTGVAYTSVAVPVDDKTLPALPASPFTFQGFALALDTSAPQFPAQWITGMPAANSFDGADLGPAIAFGPVDGMYVAGVFDLPFSNGGVVLLPNNVQGTPRDFYVAHLTDTGVIEWIEGYGSSANDLGRLALATDANDSVVVTGLLNDYTDLGGAALVRTDGQPSTFLAKYSDSGKLAWHVVLPVDYPLASTGPRIAVDSADRIVVVGSLSRPYSAKLKNQQQVDLAPIGGADAFVAKFAPTGVPHWVRTLGSSNTSQHAAAIAVGPQDLLIVAGNMAGALVDPKAPLALDLGDPGDAGDIFALRLDP